MFQRLIVAASLACAACSTVDTPDEDPIDTVAPEASPMVRSVDAHGRPTFVSGALDTLPGWRDIAPADRAAYVLEHATQARRVFGLRSADLRFVKSRTNERGEFHVRYQQYLDDIAVIGARWNVHVDADGVIFAANGHARDGVVMSSSSQLEEQHARQVLAADPAFDDFDLGFPRRVYLRAADDDLHEAYEIFAAGTRDGVYRESLVYLDRTTGVTLRDTPGSRYGNIHVYDANGTNVLPGDHKRGPTDPPIGDPNVDLAALHASVIWRAFFLELERDSFDGDGEDINITVDYCCMTAQPTCNGRWDGDRIQLEALDGTTPCNPAEALDLIAHEYMHGVTDRESDLEGTDGETGAINESLSDIFAAFVEAWSDSGEDGGYLLSADTWTLREDLGVLRDLCDPASEHGEEFWRRDIEDAHASDDDRGDHQIAGIQNLMFCLLARGGSHPSGASRLAIRGIGFESAIKLLYRTLTEFYLEDDSKFADMRTAMETASILDDLSVSCAWAAVGVGSVPADCNKGDIVWRQNGGTARIWRMNGGTISSSDTPPLTVLAPPWQLRGVGDFDTNGRSDLLWENETTHEVRLWKWQAVWVGPISAPVTVGGVTYLHDAAWIFQGIGDLDGGGLDDVLWRHNVTGEFRYWQLKDTAIVNQPLIGTELNAQWKVKGLGDFNSDGREDVLMQHETSLAARIWFASPISGTTAIAAQTSLSGIAGYTIRGIGDFNGDGNSDFVVQDAVGDAHIWFMNGTSATPISRHIVTTAAGPYHPTLSWQFSAIGDFNGDGMADMVWRNLNTNVVQVWLMNTYAIQTLALPAEVLAVDWNIKGTGSFD